MDIGLFPFSSGKIDSIFRTTSHKQQIELIYWMQICGETLKKMKDALGFVEKILDCGHGEKVPELDGSTECWYLPRFTVYHPKKPGSIRCVFD
jgi:hypothetical protein